MDIKDVFDLVSAVKANYDSAQSKDVAVKLAHKTVESINDSNNQRVSDFGKLEPTESDKEEIINDILLDTFDRLSKKEKLKILQTAFLAHRKDIEITELLLNSNKKDKDKERQPTEFEITQHHEILKLRTWLVKVVMTILIFFAFCFMSLFLYFTIKNGVLSDKGIFVSILSTIGDVLKLLFSSKP